MTVTNNIIANNVAGWDGGGVSLQDALKVSFVNNTVASNDTTASAGVAVQDARRDQCVLAAAGLRRRRPDPSLPQNPSCAWVTNAPHGPQPAGLVTMANTPNLVDALPA